MKKIIATTALVATACFGFYINESGSMSNATGTLVTKVGYENILGLNIIGSHRLDIGQADIK